MMINPGWLCQAHWRISADFTTWGCGKIIQSHADSMQTIYVTRRISTNNESFRPLNFTGKKATTIKKNECRVRTGFQSSAQLGTNLRLPTWTQPSNIQL